MEIGIAGFASASTNNEANAAVNCMDSLAQLLERIVHADKAGLDVFGILRNIIVRHFLIWQLP